MLEAAGHGNKQAREDKLAFYRELSGPFNPIDAPNDLLRKTATSNRKSRGAQSTTHSLQSSGLHQSDGIPERLLRQEPPARKKKG